MDATTLKYGLACVAVLGFTFWGRKTNPHAFWCAIMLTASCFMTNGLNSQVGYPDCYKLYAPMNLACGAFVSYLVWKRPQVWSLLLALSFLVQIGFETRFAWSGGYSDYSLVADHNARENLVFKFQLFLGCVPGVLDVLGILLRKLLPDPRWHFVGRAASRTKRQAGEG